MPSMQKTTSRDNFRGKLHFQNVLNFGSMACLIYGDIENIFFCFLFRKKETVKGDRYLVPRVSGQLTPRKIVPSLELGFGLGLRLELELGGNFPRGQFT